MLNTGLTLNSAGHSWLGLCSLGMDILPERANPSIPVVTQSTGTHWYLVPCRHQQISNLGGGLGPSSLDLRILHLIWKLSASQTTIRSRNYKHHLHCAGSQRGQQLLGTLFHQEAKNRRVHTGCLPQYQSRNSRTGRASVMVGIGLGSRRGCVTDHNPLHLGPRAVEKKESS